MLLNKGYVYVCGDAANMAREVHSTLIQIVAEQRGVSNEKAEEVVKSMRSANQYQVRVHPATTLPSRGPGGSYYPMPLCAFVANMWLTLLSSRTGGCVVIENRGRGGETSVRASCIFLWDTPALQGAWWRRAAVIMERFPRVSSPFLPYG